MKRKIAHFNTVTNNAILIIVYVCLLSISFHSSDKLTKIIP